MNDVQVISQFIGAIKEQMAEISEDAMLRPKSSSFDHGVQAGRYQGLASALDTLDAILRDEYSRRDNL